MFTNVYKVKWIQLGISSCNCAKATNYARVSKTGPRPFGRSTPARDLIVKLVDWKSESGLCCVLAGHFLYQFQTIDISGEEEAATLQNRILPSPQVVGDAAAEGSQSSESTSGPLSSQHPIPHLFTHCCRYTTKSSFVQYLIRLWIIINWQNRETYISKIT